MKRTRQCPKCGSRAIGHLAEQLDINDSVGGPLDGHPGVVRGGPAAARAVGYEATEVNTGWTRHGRGKPVIGKLEAYVCTECGYHETYVVDANTIAWQKLVGFSWVNPTR